MIDVARYELGRGSQWSNVHIVSEVVGILERLGVGRVVLDKFGDNAHLIPAFEEAGVEVTRLDTADMRAATAALTDALVNGRVKHLGQEPLSVAVLGAEKRSSGESTWLL